jgi:hypothetical protein
MNARTRTWTTHASRTSSRRLALAAGALALTLGACSSPPKPAVTPREPEPEAEAPVQRSSGMGAVAEIGALDEKKARASFESALEGLQSCVSEGSRLNEMMGGSIEFAVKVNSEREAANVWAVESSLGQRETERCMFDALRQVSWPAPVGGTFAIAKTSFEFDLPKGVKPPTPWDAGRVSDVVEELGPKMDECTGGRHGDVLVTLYVGADGKAISGGASSSTETEDDAVDCVLGALLSASYPSPGDYPAKVRFRI